ncbi:MAG: SpoIID/LytB domain-containing protein [Deltaproteobacteria bacterium]|nr:SpoIID/LytB domain-containing protein [Deltaproteobacteria bacterium]
MRIFLLVVLLAWSRPILADEVLRIGILSRHRPAELLVEALPQGAKLQVEIVALDGRVEKRQVKRLELRCGGDAPVMGLGRAGARFRLRPSRGKMLRLTLPGKFKRSYKGWLDLSENKGLCRVVLHSPLEAYVESVACAELGPAAPAEALRAQAILARTYALTNRGRHEAEGFELCDLTHCQMFTGEQACSSAQRSILASVRGQVLRYGDKLAQVAFFSTCAGHTASARDVWGPAADRPYLRGVKDGESQAHCAASDHWRWRFQLPATELCARLRGELPGLGAGPCRVTVAKEGHGGWVREMSIEAAGRVELSGARFHMLMGRWYGWGKFKSGRFQVEARGPNLVFLGQGMGHGVGLCQHGAMGMAKKGAEASEILKHYFPGTKIGRLP